LEFDLVGAPDTAHFDPSTLIDKLKYVSGLPPICGSGTHQSHQSSRLSWSVTGIALKSQRANLTSAKRTRPAQWINQVDKVSKHFCH
jgi:hypothetical protein